MWKRKEKQSSAIDLDGRLIVNLLDSNYRGYGPLQGKLLRTEYYHIIKKLERENRSKKTPYLTLDGSVITLISGSRGKIGYEDALTSMRELKSFCVKNKVERIVIPFQLWVYKGNRFEDMLQIAEALFNDSGIKVEII